MAEMQVNSFRFHSKTRQEDCFIPESEMEKNGTGSLNTLNSPLFLSEKNELPKKQRLSSAQSCHSQKDLALHLNQTMWNNSTPHTNLIDSRPLPEPSQEKELLPHLPPRPSFSETQPLSTHSNQNEYTAAILETHRINQPLPTPSQEKELLPQLPPRPSFSETEPSTIDFNRNVWSHHAIMDPHRIDQALFHQKDPLMIEDEAAHFPKVGAYFLAQAVANSYAFHLTLQKNAFETLHAIQQGVKKLREESLQLLKEQISNDHPKWKSYLPFWLKSIFPYLSYITLIATGLFGMHALIGGSALLGGASLGSFASFITGKLLNNFTHYKRIAMIFIILGTATSIYITKKYMLHFCTRLIPQIFAQSVRLAQAIGEQAFGYYQAKGASLRWKHQSQQIIYQWQQDNLKKEGEETMNHLSTTSQGKMVGTMSKVIAKESELKSEMARKIN